MENRDGLIVDHEKSQPSRNGKHPAAIETLIFRHGHQHHRVTVGAVRVCDAAGNTQTYTPGVGIAPASRPHTVVPGLWNFFSKTFLPLLALSDRVSSTPGGQIVAAMPGVFIGFRASMKNAWKQAVSWVGQ